MALAPPPDNKVEVDMVPLIDIISLLLMFLIIVGDTAANATNIDMKLPRSEMAKTEKDLIEKDHMNFEGRIIIQMKKEADGSYRAVVDNQSYELLAGGGSKTLLDYLDRQISLSKSKGWVQVASDGAVSSPVKLRIPADAPMKDVQRVVMTCARVGLVNVQYAADPVKK